MEKCELFVFIKLKVAFFQFAVEPSREKLLPDPLKMPYIQPKYTIVIEMKNVLVSPEWTVRERRLKQD